MMPATAWAIMPVTDERPTPRAPWPVVAAFYLWWTLIAAQSIGLAWMGFTFAQAAGIGGPAWDILFVDVPIGLPTLIIVAVEFVFVLRLRRRSRPARIVLAVLAIPAAVSLTFMLSPIWWAGLATAASVGFVSPSAAADVTGFWVAVVIIAVVAITAAVLPFTRPVGRFFWKGPSPASGQPPLVVPPPYSPPASAVGSVYGQTAAGNSIDSGGSAGPPQVSD